MSENTFIDMVVYLFGTPNVFVGWVIIDILAFMLLAVLLTIIFCLPFFLFGRSR